MHDARDYRQLIAHVSAIQEILEAEQARAQATREAAQSDRHDARSRNGEESETAPREASRPADFRCASFDAAFERLIGHEGGFQQHHNDRGNWTSGKVGKGELKGTKFGISAMSYPELDIAALTVEQAREIYRRDFWERFCGDVLDERIAFNLFDAAVHHGPGNAIRLVQRAVGVADDGVFGPLTREAVMARSPALVAARLNACRLLFCSRLSTWRDFGKGWTRRFAQNILDSTDC